MRRISAIILALCPIMLASCDRSTRAELILTIGLNAHNTNFFPTSEERSLHEAARDTSIIESLAVLTELRQMRDSETTVDETRLAASLDAIALLADAASVDPESNPIREALLACLEIATEFDEQTYGPRQDTYRRKLFEEFSLSGDLARHSAQRLVNNQLSARRFDEIDVTMIKLHIATYPDCDMNVGLILSVLKRLEEEDRIPEALSLAHESLRSLREAGDAPLLVELLQRFYVEYPTTVGVPMNFAGPDLTGGRFELESLRGEPTLVVFWATWCERCRSDIPRIKQVADRFGLSVVGVNLDSSRDELESFIATNAIEWRQIFTSRSGQTGWHNPIARHFRVRSIPYAVLVDPDGTIAAAGLQAGDLAEALENALAQ